MIDIRDIRKARADGEKRRHVFARYPQYSTGTLQRIWDGLTAANISQHTTNEELAALEKQ